ncbi:ER membrane protein complex subunit 1 [Cryptosporidium felis]|nr:ER membrane protein complex subunit 1 [Cryptosporidium felis]
MYLLRPFILFWITLISNCLNLSFSLNGVFKVGIESIYSVIDHNDKSLLLFECGRVISLKDNLVLGSLQEFSSGDQLVDFVKVGDSSYVLLIMRSNNSLIVRNMKVDFNGKILLNWDSEIDFLQLTTKKMYYVSGLIYILLESDFLIIDEYNGEIKRKRSFDLELTPFLLQFDEFNKPTNIFLFDKINNEIQIIDYNLLFTENKDSHPRNIIKMDPNAKIFTNSGILLKVENETVLNLLFLNDNNIFGLFTYNFERKIANTLLSNLDSSLINDELSLQIEMESILRYIEPKKICLTLTRYKYNIGFPFLNIFETNRSFVLRSYSPIINSVHSSLGLIIQGSPENSNYLTIINYNDMTSNLSFTSIFNYFLPVNENRIYRFNLKLEYKDNTHKLWHGQIKCLVFTVNIGLIILFNDSTMVSLSLNCDNLHMKCERPKIIEIYENIISEIYSESLIFYDGKKFQNEDSIFKVNSSNFFLGKDLYQGFHDGYLTLNNEIGGTILLTVNRHLSIFAYDVKRDRIIWRNDSLKVATNNVEKIRLFIVEDVTDPELFVIADRYFITKISIRSGKTITQLNLPESSNLIISRSYKMGDSLNSPLILLLDSKDNIVNIFDLSNLNMEPNNFRIKENTYFYITFTENSISCFSVSSERESNLNWRYNLEKQEGIVTFSTPFCGECESFPVIVSEMYDIINRFDFSFLLGVITNNRKVLIFNSINGNLLYSSILPDTFGPPYKFHINQNIIIITSFHTVHCTPVVVIFELYQFIEENSSTNIIDKLAFLFSREKNVKESIVDPERPIYVQQSLFIYNYELPIDYLLLSRTSKSITSKLIIFGSYESSIIEGIPEKLFTTLRPNHDGGSSRIINGNLPIYQPFISKRVKLPTKLTNKKIFSIPNSFESTSILISIGYNSFGAFEFYPNTSFDKLPDNFNFSSITYTLTLVISITIISIHFYQKRQFNNWV